MPSIEENRRIWSGDWTWDRGDEWSLPWGGPEPQWYGTIYPRIHAFLPARTILEIAPGYGRWTQFLGRHCERLIIVDLVPECIDYCRRRFADWSHVEYWSNDGISLGMVPDASVDFVFSFDSLVHAEQDVLDGYLRELRRKLTPDGVGFIHHSNLGAYAGPSGMDLPESRPNPQMRSLTTADAFERSCGLAGLRCIGQELVNWQIDILNDCFSLFTPAGSRWARENRRIENSEFHLEIARIRSLAEMYGRESFGQAEAAPPQGRWAPLLARLLRRVRGR